MTNEERLALIERIKEVKRTGKANRFEITKIACIALTALTAPKPEPEAFYLYREHNPSNGMKTDWVEVDKEQYGMLLEITDRETSEFRIGYSAPPAPQVKKVKLPKKQKPKESAHPDMHTLAVGWNECIDHFEGILRAAWIEVEE